jgi:hypothetical protein
MEEWDMPFIHQALQLFFYFNKVIPVPKGHTTKPQVGKEEYVHSFLTQRRLGVSESFKAYSWAFHLL